MKKSFYAITATMSGKTRWICGFHKSSNHIELDQELVYSSNWVLKFNKIEEAVAMKRLLENQEKQEWTTNTELHQFGIVCIELYEVTNEEEEWF